MDYDICDPSIRCGADKIGATVFLVDRKDRLCRVLAYTQQDAERLARDHDQQEEAPDTGPSLFDAF